jgi:hypothetical protein
MLSILFVYKALFQVYLPYSGVLQTANASGKVRFLCYKMQAKSVRAQHTVRNIDQSERVVNKSPLGGAANASGKFVFFAPKCKQNACARGAPFGITTKTNEHTRDKKYERP